MKRSKRRESRRQEIREMNFHQTREEHQAATFKAAPPLQPKNQLQAEYIHAINCRPYVLCSGLAGVGKTYIAGRLAARELKGKEIERIVLIRPAASASKSLGYFKGTVEEKMKSWLAPIMGALQDEFSPSEIAYMMKEGVDRLICQPLETVKGNSWKNAFVIVDEAEDCTIKELKSLMTRLGTNSTMVICGDVTQVDIKRSGMYDLLEAMKRSPILNDAISHIAFEDYEDIIRSRAVRDIVEGFDEADGIRLGLVEKSCNDYHDWA